MAAIARVLTSIALMSWAGCAAAQTPSKQALEEMLAKDGLQSIRGVDSDICYPANAAEYQALGKSAILMLKSDSAISTELPLRSVYLIHQKVRIPLQRLAATAKDEDDHGRATQFSFYLLPIHYMKLDADLLVDFTGDRIGFSVMSFDGKSRDDQMPAFARLDEYDMPQDADPKAVAEVLAREYPDQAVELH